ncbi:uncharacterized protein [Euwallacea fornicatus]|uniref:uncharacterized protein n=1 Tax=Euwallacea fornicatus TaxID=995702 RepID=UPI00338FE755
MAGQSMETDIPFIPEHIIKHFKCSICDKYLLVGPILTDDGSTFKCGRCSFISSPNLKNPVYGFEKLVSFMTFPCTFKGCNCLLDWSTIELHEAICIYRTVNCPYYQCEHVLPAYELAKHFQDTHKKYVCLEECCIINRNIKQPNRCLMRMLLYNGQTYLMFNYRDNTRFWVSVYCMGAPNENLSFEITFVSPDGKRFIKLTNQPIKTFKEQEHCITCLEQECNSKFHKFSKLYKGHEKIRANMTTAIDVNDIANLLKSDNVNYKIRIVEVVETMEEDSKKEFPALVLRQNLKCSICKILMSAPIYNCSTGHTICQACKLMALNCVLCDRSFTESRNFALEIIADQIKLKCINSKSGCTFVGNVNESVEHELNCSVISQT